jgi:hypothetical protein
VKDTISFTILNSKLETFYVSKTTFYLPKITNMGSISIKKDKPIIGTLEEIYEKEFLPYQQKRYKKVVEKFKSLYDSAPDFIARAPGRVNLIGKSAYKYTISYKYHNSELGEHVDYSGYAVFPMAIEQDIIIAVRVVEHSKEIYVNNMDKKKYTPRTYNIDKIETNPQKHHWTSYILAGYLV